MTTPFRAAWLLAVLLTQTAPLHAGDTPVCHESEKYLIVEKPDLIDAGFDFLVKPKGEATQTPCCNYRKSPGSFWIKNETHDFYLGVQRDLLILDSGTNVDGRDLVIRNLLSRKTMARLPYAEITTISPTAIGFWMPVEEPATNKRCPRKAAWETEGLGAGIEVLSTLDLKTFRVTKSARKRCMQRQ